MRTVGLLHPGGMGASIGAALRLAAARANGVDEALLDEWARSQPGLAARSEVAVASARKAWRFAGEMDEIAACFTEAGLPDGFHRAAAELYRRLAAFKDVEGDPPLAEVLRRIRPDRLAWSRRSNAGSARVDPWPVAE